MRGTVKPSWLLHLTLLAHSENHKPTLHFLFIVGQHTMAQQSVTSFSFFSLLRITKHVSPQRCCTSESCLPLVAWKWEIQSIEGDVMEHWFDWWLATGIGAKSCYGLWLGLHRQGVKLPWSCELSKLTHPSCHTTSLLVDLLTVL